MNPYETIRLDVAEGVARLTLNKPERLNSLDSAMSAELIDALNRVEQNPHARVLVITGSGRGFCAGAFLGGDSGFSGMPDLGDILEAQYNPIIEALRRLPAPVIAAVNGPAAGAGASLALACDVVIAARSAKFLQAFTRIGLLPDMGGTYFLPRLVGTARAMGLALLADSLGAEEAERWGLIWRCVDDEALAHATQELAQRLARGPRHALARTKRAIYASAENSLTEQLALERDMQRELGRTEDFLEGVSAFLAKRTPQFSGR